MVVSVCTFASAGMGAVAAFSFDEPFNNCSSSSRARSSCSDNFVDWEGCADVTLLVNPLPTSARNSPAITSHLGSAATRPSVKSSSIMTFDQGQSYRLMSCLKSFKKRGSAAFALSASLTRARSSRSNFATSVFSADIEVWFGLIQAL